MNPIILAIDLGTSGPKVALVTPAGEVLACAVGTCELTILPGGGAEQDPADWWRAIRETTRELLASGVADPARIAAIGCTSQWSGTVAVDKLGQPLMNAIIWMDTRGAPHVRRITGGWPKIEGYGLGRLLTWLRRSGGMPTHSGKDSIAHILYIKHERPAIYQQTYKFLEPKDYLNLRLTGQFASSYDAITLHWLTDNRDINNIDYDATLLRLATIDRARLPDLKPPAAILGPILPEVAAELGVPLDIPVVMGTPDLQSAAIGSGAVGDYEPHLYIGTSAWLTCHVPKKKTDIFHNMAALPAAVPGRYFIANEQETAGACLSFLRDNLLFPDDALGTPPPPDDLYRQFDALVATAPAGCEGLIFTPWLHGERTPMEDPYVRAGFYNLSLRSTRAHLVRAVFEGVAFNARWLLRYVEKFAGRRLDDIRFIGGGANSDIWCQIQADILNRRILQVADPVQANARGAGLLAAAAIGATNFDRMGATVAVAHVYEPDAANRRVYDRLFAEYEEIYRQNKGMFARLNK